MLLLNKLYALENAKLRVLRTRTPACMTDRQYLLIL